MSLLEFLEKATDEKSLPGSVDVYRALGNLATTMPPPELPISPDQSSWLTLGDPERLSRTFEFKKFEHLDYFVNESLRYQERSQHHAKMIIDHRSVTVETYTHDLDQVTQQDLDLTEFLDEIYSDVRFFDQGER